MPSHPDRVRRNHTVNVAEMWRRANRSGPKARSVLVVTREVLTVAAARELLTMPDDGVTANVIEGEHHG